MSVEESDPVGSVAEEAARLLGLFAAGMPEAQLRAAGARAAGEEPPGHVCPECGHDPHAASAASAASASVCRVCPVCRILEVVKAISPDTLDRLADVVDLVSDGLRGFAASRRETTRPAPATAWAPRAHDGGARPAPAPDPAQAPTPPDPDDG